MSGDLAPNVVVALARVAGDLPGIGKDSQASQQQGGYSYRGIEAITRHAAPLFAKHGVVFVPEVVSWETRDLTVNNKPWTDERLMVKYRVFGPGGPTDMIEVGPIAAIGRDNSDKGTNKALTQAFKYALIQTLCIGDGRDDTDGQTNVRDAPPPVSRHAIEELQARIETVTGDTRDQFMEWKADQGFPWPWPESAVSVMHRKLDEIVGDGGEPEPGASPPGEGSTSEDAPASPPTDVDGPGEETDPRGNAADADGPPQAPHGYDLWSRDELIAECKERPVPHSGTKDRLVHELRAWDALYNPGVTKWDEKPF